MVYLVRISIVLSTLASLLCSYLFYNTYWRFKEHFNDQGRYFDPVEGVVYLEQSGMIWGSLAFLFALLPLFCLTRIWFTRRF